MYPVVIVLSILAAILLIIVVLIQKSKGGGLSSSFAGSNQILGVNRTNSFIEKATWTLAATICVLAIVSAFVMPKVITESGSRIKTEATVNTISGTEFATEAPTTEFPATIDSSNVQ